MAPTLVRFGVVLALVAPAWLLANAGWGTLGASAGTLPVIEQLQCPPPPGPGWRIDNDAAFRGEIVPGAGSFLAVCQYERDDSFATVSMSVSWWPGANPPTGPAGFCGREETTTPTTALRRSASKAAYVQVGDSTARPVGPNQLLTAAQPLLAQAEQRAAACAPSAGGLSCPQTLAGIPFSTFGGGGSPSEKPGGGTFVLLCRYIAPSGAVANLEVEWDQAAKTPHTACGRPRLDTTGGGVPSTVIYSQTKAAHLTVLGAAASVTDMVRAGEPLLAAVEPLAVPCPERPGAAVPTVAAAGGTGTPAEGAVGDDELYREGTVPDEGIASSVLEPGSELPSGGEAAAAAAAATGVVAAGAAVQAARSGRRRGPLGRLPGIVEDRLVSERDRVVMEALARKGITPPLVAAIGGPGRVVRLGTRFVRNPVRATGDFLKDTFHNLTHPKDMFRHVRNGVRRVVESSPAGPVVNLLSRLFRRRPRGPRGPQLSTQRISDAVVEPGRGLQSAPEKPPTFAEMYGAEAPDAPEGERGP